MKYSWLTLTPAGPSGLPRRHRPVRLAWLTERSHCADHQSFLYPPGSLVTSSTTCSSRTCATSRCSRTTSCGRSGTQSSSCPRAVPSFPSLHRPSGRSGAVGRRQRGTAGYPRPTGRGGWRPGRVRCRRHRHRRHQAARHLQWTTLISVTPPRLSQLGRPTLRFPCHLSPRRSWTQMRAR
jgi:hypothetical protein